MKAINILDLRDSPWVDGPGRTVLETAEALDRTKHRVFVGSFCAGQDSSNAYLSAASSRSLDVVPIAESGPLDWTVVRQVLTVIDKIGIDVVHTHDFRSNVVGLLCARSRILPVVTTCHGWISNNRKGRIKKCIDLKVIQRFDRIVTVSELMREQLINQGVDSKKIEVVVNALNIDNFKPSSSDRGFREELGIRKSTKLIVNIGRLSAEKGQALLLDSLAIVHQGNPDIFLCFVGIGPEEEGLKARVSSLGLTAIVRFCGYRSDMNAVYNSADLVVQASSTEGMPNVILESLLMRTPVVATDVGGTSEIVEHGRSGFLIAPNSKSQLVDGLTDFLHNESHHRKMASCGRDIVSVNFNHDARVRKFAGLYSEIAMSGAP